MDEEEQTQEAPEAEKPVEAKEEVEEEIEKKPSEEAE